MKTLRYITVTIMLATSGCFSLSLTHEFPDGTKVTARAGAQEEPTQEKPVELPLPQK